MLHKGKFSLENYRKKQNNVNRQYFIEKPPSLRRHPALVYLFFSFILIEIFLSSISLIAISEDNPFHAKLMPRGIIAKMFRSFIELKFTLLFPIN